MLVAAAGCWLQPVAGRRLPIGCHLRPPQNQPLQMEGAAAAEEFIPLKSKKPGSQVGGL